MSKLMIVALLSLVVSSSALAGRGDLTLPANRSSAPAPELHLKQYLMAPSYRAVGGIVRSNLIGDRIPSEFTTGFVGGILADIKMNGPTELETGLLFSQFGGREKVSGVLTSLSETMSFLALPILAKQNLDIYGQQAFIKGGVLGMTRLNATGRGAIAGTDGQEASADIASLVRKEAVNAEIGAGVKLPVTNGTFTAEVTYDLGLSNISERGKATYNQAFALSTGFLF